MQVEETPNEKTRKISSSENKNTDKISNSGRNSQMGENYATPN